MIETHKGIYFEKGRKFGADYYVHVIDLNQVRMKLTTPFDTVTHAVEQWGAQVGFNGGGWEKKYPYRNNEYFITEGFVRTLPAIPLRPCIEVTRDNQIRFHKNQPHFRYSWNVWGFDRMIAIDGSYDARVTNNDAAPRTIYGVDELGRLVVMVCEGRQPDQKGLTFREVWDVMQMYNVHTCGNADGGYSSAAVNTYFSPSLLNTTYTKEYRRVVHQVLFFAEENPDNYQNVKVEGLSDNLGNVAEVEELECMPV